jgi:hypothetical protein
MRLIFYSESSLCILLIGKRTYTHLLRRNVLELGYLVLCTLLTTSAATSWYLVPGT